MTTSFHFLTNLFDDTYQLVIDFVCVKSDPYFMMSDLKDQY